MEEIFSFAKDTDTDVLGIYDGDGPVGFAVLLKGSECAYLYYLAVDGNIRSKGYGSAALKDIIKRYGELQIILDFEEIDARADNYEQRLRRKSFYLKNGFHETGNYTLLRGARFEVVCSGGELKRENFGELLKIIHAHRADFPDIIL